VVEIQSIKNNKLCETNPIFRMPKMLVSAVVTITTNKKLRTMNSLKRTQTKPILPAYMAGKIALSEACGERSRTVEGPIE
jgi:hypothetical protein